MSKPRLKLVRCHRGDTAAEMRSKLTTFSWGGQLQRIASGPLKSCWRAVGFGAPPWSVFNLTKAPGPVLEFKSLHSGGPMKRDAVFSVCGLFRYWLLREWDATRPTMVLLMLNPSTADASKDDPTIRKGIGFAERLGFGRLVVVNLFAYRATDPNDLRRYGYQVGPKNDDFIAEAVLFMNRGHLGRLVCAWGANARGLARPGEVLSDLRRMGVQPMALRLAADGVPWHPLMLSYNDATGAPRQLVEMP